MQERSEVTRAIFASLGEQGTIPGEWRGVCRLLLSSAGTYNGQALFGHHTTYLTVIIQWYGGAFHGFLLSPTLGPFGAPWLRATTFEEICALMAVSPADLVYTLPPTFSPPPSPVSSSE